ncbi:MAG TPA: hypothetical protein VF059_11720 [Casimicrobiaceae bacterium]
MSGYRLTAWLRPLLTLVALAGVLSLAACGGGNGAPNNPYKSGGGPLTITPPTATTYAGTPFTFAITGGTQPFTIISSDQEALPVVGTLDGNTLVVIPGNVGTDTSVTLTVRDGLGATVSAGVTVRPNLLLPSSITITGNPNCAASGATLCSGQDGSASVVITGPAGAPLAGRDIRFDVVQGSFSISSTTPGQPIVQSLTVATDVNGLAAVRLIVPATAATQFATLRATDVTSGSSIVAQFTIAQFVNGSSVLTVIPTGTTTFTGPDTAHCSSGASATFYVFGGTPPYTVATNFPGAISISGAPVQRSGDGFTITTNGTCFTGLTFKIADATGRVLTTPPTASNVVGTAEPPPPPIVLTPASIPSLGTIACAAGSQVGQILATGGTGTYAVAVAPQGTASGGPIQATVNGGTIAVSVGASDAHGDFAINVSSGSAAVKTATIHCS